MQQSKQNTRKRDDMRFYFDEAKIWETQKEDVFQQINRSGLPLVLFGKAPATKGSFLHRIHVPLSVICDNDPVKWGTCLWGLEVVDPSRLPELYSAYNVLILVPFEHQIIPQLQGLPVPPAQIFRLDFYFEEPDAAGFFQEKQIDLKRIYTRLADKMSQDTFEAAIHYRINRDPQILKQVALPREEQYFPAALGDRPFLSSDEVFVDAGAFIGDTIKEFYDAVQGQYRAIYAFEPEHANYQRLLQNTCALPNVFCGQTAVSDQMGELRFTANDSGSAADMFGNKTVQTDTLDHLLCEVPVTYLKMDIEGMECAALRGAARVIHACRPKLAICAYHSNTDMVQIPKLIWALHPDYKLYFRHYTNAIVETVCYAV